MQSFITNQVLPRLTERSTVFGAITLILAIVHYDLSGTTSDLIATAISSVASLALIYLREHQTTKTTTTVILPAAPPIPAVTVTETTETDHAQ